MVNNNNNHRHALKQMRGFDSIKPKTMKKQYTPIENAFYWIVTSTIVAIGITTLMLTFALVEYIFA